MKGLLLNNYYSMLENIKLSTLIALFLTVMAIFFGQTFLSIAIAVSIAIFPVNIGSSLQKDETSKWNKFEITVPVKRRSIVLCKYLSYLALVCVGLLSSLVIVFLTVCLGHTIEAQSVTYGLAYGLSLTLFTGAFLYPALLKLGAFKSELLILVSALLALVCMTGLSMMMIMLFGGLELRSLSLGLTVTMISLICFICSYFVSVRIHSTKEF